MPYYPPTGAPRRWPWSWAEQRDLRLLLAFLLPIGGGWLFVELADEVREGEAEKIDRAVLLALRSADDLGDALGPPWVEEMMRDFSALGGFGVLLLVVLAAAGYLLLRGSRQALWLLLAASAGGMLLSYSAKLLFDRARPDLVPHLSNVDSPSFPSGHSTMSAVVYLTLAVLLARLYAPARFKAYIIGIALGITLLVGVSRVYVGVHYPTDVLAGWALGLSWAVFSYLVALVLQRRRGLR